MADYVKLRIVDHLTGETLYRHPDRGDGVPWGGLQDTDGAPIEFDFNIWVGATKDTIIKPLWSVSGSPVSVYTSDWLTQKIFKIDRFGNEAVYHAGGMEYPGGRPTELDYTPGMDTVNPPQPDPEPDPEPDPDPDPDPEPDPEPDPDPDPESRVFDEYDLIEAMGDEAPSIEVARAAIRAATDLIDTYTRGAAYRRIRLPRPGVNAVAHSVAARIAANPGFISRRDQAGNFSRSLGAGFNGFTLTEKTALNSYRRTAR